MSLLHPSPMILISYIAHVSASHPFPDQRGCTRPSVARPPGFWAMIASSLTLPEEQVHAACRGLVPGSPGLVGLHLIGYAISPSSRVPPLGLSNSLWPLTDDRSVFPPCTHPLWTLRTSAESDCVVRANAHFYKPRKKRRPGGGEEMG